MPGPIDPWFRNPRRAVVFPFVASSLVLLSACQTQRIQLTAEQEKVRTQLGAIDPLRDPMAVETRIIDVHTHTFNARYLPLRNILLGKRDAFPPVSWLISDPCAKTLAQALSERTELAPAAGQPGRARTMKSKEHYASGVVCGILLGLLDKAATAGTWDKGMSHVKQMEKLDEVADQMTFQERLAVRTAGHMMGMDESLKAPDQKGALRGVVRFIWMLTQNDAEMARLFRAEYAEAPMRGHPLMVSHLMDLAPVYDQAPDGNELLDFATQQVKRAEAFQKRPDSGMVYFVAYNPYRDHWMNEKPGDALRVVRTAIEQQGAWGVKVYPPSGYRPAGNEIQGPVRALFSAWPGKEWDARYLGLGASRDAELDRRLEELLVWCIKTEVPVFVHAGTGEFEARKGYGLYHSNPHFWRRFLESHPEPDGSPCRLRLCLGHAGGEDFWFGGKNYASWGSEVYDLCREFPNVYCEITTQHALLDPDKQAYFAAHLMELFEAPDRLTGKNRYPFAKKLLYGTDWYLPDAGKRRDILMATEQVFLHEKLRPHYDDYFNGNTLRFLNAKARLRDSRHPLPPEVRTRLQEFLATAR